MTIAHLHNHTDLGSLLDGAQTPTQLAERCKALGHEAVAQTDHGSMRGFFKFHLACKKVGIKPVFGLEAYLCRDRHQRGLTTEQVEEAKHGVESKREQKEAVKAAEERFGTRKRFHTCLFAMDDEGLRNLFRLSSIGWGEGFYYRPRIDLAALREHSQGLIISTACVGGILAHLIEKEDHDGVVNMLADLVEVFGDRLYLEVMPHDFEMQRHTNEWMVALAEEYGVPLLATNDAHYALAEDWRLHEAMLAMQSHTVWSNPERWKFPGGHDYYLKTREEMEQSFAAYHPAMTPAHVKQALDNTLELTARCTAKVVQDNKLCLLPRVDLDPDSVDEFLRWAAEAYPESYDLGKELSPLPCYLDVEAPSTAPYVVGSETSKEAVESLTGKLGTMRQVILDHVSRTDGLTCEEVELQLGMRHQTAGPRINELVKVELLYDSGEKKRTTSGRMATVWRAKI